MLGIGHIGILDANLFVANLQSAAFSIGKAELAAVLQNDQQHRRQPHETRRPRLRDWTQDCWWTCASAYGARAALPCGPGRRAPLPLSDVAYRARATSNERSVTVQVPRANLFTVEG
jgi:hypothetical protein